MGVDIRVGRTKQDLIRDIQIKEGYSPCFTRKWNVRLTVCGNSIVCPNRNLDFSILPFYGTGQETMKGFFYNSDSTIVKEARYANTLSCYHNAYSDDDHRMFRTRIKLFSDTIDPSKNSLSKAVGQIDLADPCNGLISDRPKKGLIHTSASLVEQMSLK